MRKINKNVLPRLNTIADILKGTTAAAPVAAAPVASSLPFLGTAEATPAAPPAEEEPPADDENQEGGRRRRKHKISRKGIRKMLPPASRRGAAGRKSRKARKVSRKAGRKASRKVARKASRKASRKGSRRQ
jgi:hypothetical protein